MILYDTDHILPTLRTFLPTQIYFQTGSPDCIHTHTHTHPPVSIKLILIECHPTYSRHYQTLFMCLFSKTENAPYSYCYPPCLVHSLPSNIYWIELKGRKRGIALPFPGVMKTDTMKKAEHRPGFKVWESSDRREKKCPSSCDKTHSCSTRKKNVDVLYRFAHA